MRKSLRGFARYLGVSDRTVSKWESGGEHIVPLQDSQALLDTAYIQADADVRARFHEALGTPEPPQNQNPLPDRFAFVPTPEPGLVNRTHELKALVSVLKEAVSTDGIGTVAVCGPGGFGKTTLATQTVHERQIRETFPEILWVETGEDCTPARVVELISDLCVHLGGTRPAFTEPEQAGFHLAHLLRGRRVLLVIDNVWSAADLAPFLLGGEDCVRLVTTRNVRVCPTGTRIVRVGPMTSAEVSELLTRNINSLAQDEAAQLSQVCGGWPLLASVIGASVSQDIAAGAPVRRVTAEARDALREYGPQAFDVWDADQRRNAIGHAITASLLSLDKSVGISGVTDLRERYLSLAVFPPAVPIPLSVLNRWWGTSYGWTPIAVRQFCRALADRSLVGAYLADRDAFTLHDVFRSYLRRTITGQWADLHRSLLDAYRPTGGEPWTVLDAEHAYMWRHLPYHLHEAGMDEELVRLLADPAFVVAKTLRAGHQSLSADAAVLEAVRSNPGADSEPGSRLDQAITLCGAGYLLYDLTARADIAATLAIALRRDHPETAAPPADSPLGVQWAQQAQHPDSAGHVGAITSVAAAAGLISSGGEDGIVRLWDIVRRRLLRSHRGHTGWVFATALSPDAQLLASAGDDGAIRLWDTRTGTATAVLPGHQRRVRSVAFSPDGAFLVSGAEDGHINVWDTVQGTLVRGLKTVGTPVWSVAVDGAARYVAASGEDEFVRLYNLTTGELLDEKAGHRDWVRSVAFAANVPLLASASGDRSVTIWSISGDKLTVLRDHPDLPSRVRAVVFSQAEESAVIAATETPELMLLTPEPSAISTRLPPGVDWVRSLTRTGNDVIVAGCEDGAVRLWSPTARSSAPDVLAPGTNTTWSVQFTNDGTHILAGDGNGTVDLLNPATGNRSRTLAAGVGRVWSLAAGGHWAAAACGDGTVRLWSLSSDSDDPPRELNTTTHRTWCVGMPSSGTHIAATTDDGLVRCWNTSTGELLWEQDARAGRLRSLSFDHPGDLLAASGGDGTVCLWNGTTGEHISRFTNPSGWARTVALDSPGERLAIGGGNGELHIRNVTADRFTAHLPGHTGRVLMAGFLSTQDHLVSAAADGTVRLWSLSEQRQLAEVRVDASLHCAAFDPTTQRVIVGSAAGTVALSVRPR